MREILFRGKNAVDKEWIYGDLIHCPNGFFMSGENADFVSIDKKTLGQFTGLLDKNGKKIFDGDIFKFLDEVWDSCYTSCGMEYDSCEVENFGVIGYCEYSGRFDFVRYKFNENSVEADLHENNCIEFAEFVSELEVIGNIYDNPELLED